MAIREDLVVSAVQFLQDPSVSSSSVENKVSFLRTKNLTQEEIDAALARTGPPPAGATYTSGPPASPAQPYYQPYPQYAWQPAPPPPAPRRDWRDWFIMTTVASAVGYGLYSLGKRYVYPLIAPPTPERLEQDKKSVEEQFDRAFALVEQLVKDTEALKKAEQQRTERLDTALTELEAAMSDLKAANRRREDDAQRIRDDVQSLKDAIPKAMESQKDLTDSRLSEINTELTSLKTLVSQRVSSGSTPSTAATTSLSTGGYLRQATGNTSADGRSAAPTSDDKAAEGGSGSSAAEPPKSLAQGSFNRPPNLNGTSGGAKASIPAWQMAAASKGAAAKTAEGEGGEQKEADGSSSS